jgi:hypothetical protein
MHGPYNVKFAKISINPLNAKLNPIRHLLALAGAHHFVHVSRIRVNQRTIRISVTYNKIYNRKCYFLIYTEAW